MQYFLTTGNGPWGNLSWSYDQIGNRLSETRDGVTDTYSYLQNTGSGNTAILQQVQLGIGGFHTYQHGPAGHMTQVNRAGNVTDLAYDAASRLSQLLQPATGNKADFFYDGRSYLSRSEAGSLGEIFRDGFEQGTSECWSQTVDASGTTLGHDCHTLVTQPVYSSDGVLRALDKVDARNGVNEVQHFLYFAGRPVAQVTVPATGAVKVEWITTDHLGTPVVVSDAVGVGVWSGGFEPFGADWGGAGDAGLELRFPGQWVDGSWKAAAYSPLAYNLYRFYFNALGGYSRVDPIGLAGGPNTFGYVSANPLSYSDRSGLKVELYCHPIGAGGQDSVRGAVGASGFGHCFVRVKCNCGQDPFDLRLEVTGRDSASGLAQIPEQPPTFSFGHNANIVPISPSVVSHAVLSLSRAILARPTFARIFSASAVQT